MSKKLVALILLPMLILTGHGATAADEQTALLEPDLRAEEIAFAEIPIVVTAARTPHRLTEAPASVDVITHEDMSNWGALTLQQAVRMIPGVDVRNYGIIFEIYIRGITGIDRVLLLMDGRRVNSAFDGSFRGDMSLAKVERIEIVRGPGSALYGPNAFGGVINIITGKGRDVEGVEITAGAGGDGTYMAQVVGGKESEDFEGFFSYRRYYTEGQELVNDNDEFRTDDLFAKLAFRGLILSAGHEEVDQGIQGRLGRESLTDHLDETTDFVDLTYEHRFGDAAVNARGFHSRREGDYTLFMSDITYESIVSGGELQGSWTFGGAGSITGGVDVRRDEGGQTGDNHKASNTGLYLEYEAKPWKPFVITLGGRYDSHSVYDEVFTPRLSAVYLLAEATSLRASYGEAFRAPSIQDLYVDFALSPTVRMQGNPDLKPEKLRTYEVAAIHSFGESLSGSLSLFLTEARDLILIQQQFSGGFLVNTPVNIGEAEIKGIEAGLKGSPARWLSFSANYSYLDAKDASEEDILYIPSHKFNAGVHLRPWNPVVFSLMGRYVGERQGYDYDARMQKELPSHTVTDFTLQADWGNVHSAVAVYNLLDEEYEETVGYPMPGRNWLLTVTYRF